MAWKLIVTVVLFQVCFVDFGARAYQIISVGDNRYYNFLITKLREGCIHIWLLWNMIFKWKFRIERFTINIMLYNDTMIFYEITLFNFRCFAGKFWTDPWSEKLVLSLKSANIGSVSAPARVAQEKRMISEFNKSYFKVLHLICY